MTKPPSKRSTSSTAGGVREWDLGKQLVGKFVEPADKDPNAFAKRNLLGGSREMTQGEWVDRQRNERNDKFAPPSAYGLSSSSSGYDERRSNYSRDSASNYDQDEDRRQRDHNRSQKHASHSKSDHIINECSNSSSDAAQQPTIGKSYETSSVFIDYKKRQGAEIAPPTSFDYYGPTPSKAPQRSPLFEATSKMDAAIAKGLKQLRDLSS